MNSEDPARAAGYVMGVGFIVVLLLIPLILNLVALRNDATNRKCALAVIILVAGWVFSALGTMILKNAEPNPLLMMVPGLVALCGIIASVVLAIIGLVEFGSRRYRHGKKRAISVLVLSALFVVMMVIGVAMGFRARTTAGNPWPAGKAGEAVTSEAWNFRIKPPAGWAPMEGAKINPLARAAFIRTSPHLFCMVLAEELPGTDVDPEAMAELIKSGLRSRGEVEFVAEGRKTVNGHEGLFLESDMRLGSQHLFFQHWVVQNRSHVYQLVVWGSGAVPEKVRAAAEIFRNGFSIIDPNRATVLSPTAASATFHSPSFGYTLDPAGTAWKRRWESLAKDLPTAEHGVQTVSKQGCFAVVPVVMGDTETDLDTLATAFIASLGVAPGEETGGSRQDCTQGPYRGRSFDCQRVHEGMNLHYRMRVLRGHGRAFLLAAWRDTKVERRAEVLDEILDGVVFDDTPPPPPPVGKFSERERIAHSMVWNDVGLALDKAGQTAAALPWFQRAFEVGKPDATILTNYVETCAKLGKTADALAFIDRHRDKFPGNQKLAVQRANAQFQSGDEEGALKSFAAIFDGGHRSDKLFADYIAELTGRGRGEAALAAIERYTAGEPTPALSRLRASVHQSRHEFDKAVEILTALQRNAPGDSETALALADCYFEAQRHTEALAECEKLIATKHDTAYVWRRKGFVEFSLKRFREAKGSFEKAHEKEPANTEIKRMLDHVSGMLGEGGNSMVKKSIEPVPVPEALLAEPTAEKADAYLKGFSAYYVHAVRAISYTKGKEFKSTDRQVIRVLDTQGVEKFSTLEIGFDPLSEEVFVNSLVVKNAAGEVVAKGRVEDSYVVDQGTGEMATQHKILHVPVPGLQPGCTIEYTVTRRDTGTAEGFRFQANSFVRSLPTLRSTLVVHAPGDAVKWEATPGVPAPKRADGRLTWIVERPPVYRWEPLQAPIETFLPLLWLGDAQSTWTAEAKTYLKEIKDRLPIDSAVHAAAAEAGKGHAKEAEKTAALARFVQAKLTYKAIEFGRRARMPAAAAQTLRNTYGDCKDHALLLVQLLESAGIPAHLALVGAGSALRPGLPSLDQFDHMIVFVPSGKGGAFFDCTSKSADLRVGPPSGLATRQALILDPERPRLETIPDYSANSSGVSASRDITFPNETDLEVREQVSFTGPSASGMRSALQSIEAANRNRWLLQAMTRELPGVDLREAQIENVDDPQAPVRLKLHYLAPRRFQNAGGQLIGQLPSVWERWFLNGDPVQQRQTPFKVWIPVNFDTRITLTPPAGWQVGAGKESKLDRPFCAGSATSRVEARQLRLEARIAQRAGQFPASEYRAYLDATAAALRLVEPGIVLKKEGK